MGIKFRDEETNKSAPESNGTPAPEGNGEALKDLRRLLEGKDGAGKLSPELEARLARGLDEEQTQIVARVTKRLDDLVETMRTFYKVRDSGGDIQEALLALTRLIQETTYKFSPVEVGSIISAGIAAIVEMESRRGE